MEARQPRLLHPTNRVGRLEVWQEPATKILACKDLSAAEVRERKLRELWDRHAGNQEQRRPLWPDDLLEIGKLIARGVEEIAVPKKDGESQIRYA